MTTTKPPVTYSYLSVCRLRRRFFALVKRDWRKVVYLGRKKSKLLALFLKTTASYRWFHRWCGPGGHRPASPRGYPRSASHTPGPPEPTVHEIIKLKKGANITNVIWRDIQRPLLTSHKVPERAEEDFSTIPRIMGDGRTRPESCPPDVGHHERNQRLFNAAWCGDGVINPQNYR